MMSDMCVVIAMHMAYVESSAFNTVSIWQLKYLVKPFIFPLHATANFLWAIFFG